MTIQHYAVTGDTHTEHRVGPRTEITILAGEQAWANGCELCEFGIAQHAPYTGAISLYEEQMHQAAHHQLTPCTCRAGHMVRQHMRRVYAAMTPEYRAWIAKRIEDAELALMEQQAAEPTVHYERIPA